MNRWGGREGGREVREGGSGGGKERKGGIWNHLREKKCQEVRACFRNEKGIGANEEAVKGAGGGKGRGIREEEVVKCVYEDR